MGAWGAGAFDNDDASDWVGELEASTDDRVIRAAFAASFDAGYLEAPQAANAIAAAEVVAAANGARAATLPASVSAWVSERRALLGGDLVELAQRSLRRVATESELQELWAEAGDPTWDEAIADLIRRLGSTP